MKQTIRVIMEQKLKIASNWMKHRMTALSRGFQMNRKVKHTNVMIEVMNRMFRFCV